MRRAQRRARRQHQLVGADVLALTPYVVAGRDRREHIDVAVAHARLLDGHDGIRAFGHDRSGRDRDRLVGCHRAGGRMTGAGLSDDGEACRSALGGVADVDATERKAVHRRAGEWRHGLDAAHVLGEDPPERVGQALALVGQRRRAVEHGAPRLVDFDQAWRHRQSVASGLQGYRGRRWARCSIC
jgi:hypothetical protein